MQVSVLKPGLLVALKTSIAGAVEYQRQELEAEHVTASGEKVARWETTRSIPDPLEHERAVKARGLARSAVVSVCCTSSFGLLCPTEKEGELQAALTAAQRIVNDFNQAARGARISVHVLIGRVADNDVEAARAIGAELRELMSAMQAGIAAADPEAIRDAANRARALSGMLSEDTGKQVSEAIAQARKVARELVKRVEGAGEQAAVVVAQCNVAAIEAARTRFARLDLDGQGQAEALPVAPRAVDFSPFAPPAEAPAAVPAAPQRSMDLDEAPAAPSAPASSALPFELETEQEPAHDAR